MGDVFDQMAASNNQNQPVAQTPAPTADAPTHGASSQGDAFDQMAKEANDPSGQNGHGASGSWEPNDPQQQPTKVGQMPRLDEVWEGVNTPLIPMRKGSAADSAMHFTEQHPEFSSVHPYVSATVKSVGDLIDTIRSFSSPLAIGTMGIGEAGELGGKAGTAAKILSRTAGLGFGAQGVHDAYEGAKEQDLHKTLNGLGQALLSAAAEMKGTKFDTNGKTNAAPAGTQGGDRTVLRPTTQTTAGVEAPITATQQPDPSFLAKVMEKTTTPGKAADFQEEQTKPAARRQVVSVLSQAAEDKIGAHEALVNGEAAPEQISGTQTPGKFMTPDEIWQEMQRSAGKTYDKARAISKQELDQWQQERTSAENEHKAAIERHNQLVDANNAELGEGEAPMDRLEYNPDDVNSRERPKTYDELKADLDAARDRLGRNNPSDVREKAKTADVPKAEKALDGWFKDHEDAIDGSEYQSAKSLWADSERFKDIANNLRGKLAKGTMTGNDIRGLEALVDGKAIKRRGAAGIGEFGRLMGPEATENLSTVAKLFDPLESTDPRSGMIRSWGSYVAKHVVATLMAPIFGISYLGIEGLNGLNELFMNHVMFDPEFGSSFARVVEATKSAISAGSKVPSAIWQPFKAMVSQIAQKYSDSKFGGEEGAVSAGGVKRAKVSPRAGAKPLAAELSPNGSGDSSASQEAINRDQSEKGQGLKRVVVDTRSGQERPLIGVDAVDYQAKPYESVEFRGGNRDGEVIDQGRSARPYQRKAALATTKAEPKASEFELTKATVLHHNGEPTHLQVTIRPGENFRKWDHETDFGDKLFPEYKGRMFSRDTNMESGGMAGNKELPADLHRYHIQFNNPQELLDAHRKLQGMNPELGPKADAPNEVKSVADAYNQSKGRPEMDATKAAVDPRNKRIADAYDAMKHNPSDPAVAKSYSALIDEAKEQRKFLESRGYKFDATSEDPYKNYEEMRDDVKNNKHLSVFTGGNPLPEDHPLAQTDPETGWKNNDLMRGVHDIMGHVAGDNDFSEQGEENAYNLHKQAFSEQARPALHTETKGQTSWFFNNKGLREGTKGLGEFPEQKAGILPEHFYSDKAEHSIASLTNENGGATFNPAKGDMAGSDAYAVPMHPELSRTVTGAKVTPEQVKKYLSIPEVKKALASDPTLSVGTWAHEGKVYFDISAAIPDRDEAIRLGKANNQKAITYLKTFEDIPLGKSGTGTDLEPQMVGDPAVTKADDGYFKQAKNELPNGSISDWSQRATQLQQADKFSKSEITTRRPTAVNADMTNNPGQHSNWDAVQQADEDAPSGTTALGKTKMGYKEKLARTVENYPGMPQVEDPAAPKNSGKIISTFINHVSANLEWLYNQIDPSIRQRTQKWYESAHQVVGGLSKTHGYSLEQGAGVTAALSPQNPWDNNLGLANRTMDIYRNRQNFPFSPEMEKKAIELRQVPTQSSAFKKLLRDINGKKLKDIKNNNPDVQAAQRALWVRLYDEAHGNSENDQYSPTGDVVGKSPDTRSWVNLDHAAKAVKILDDGSVDNINNVMGQGHKIRNFYNNIVNPNSPAGHGTIDTHAVAAALLSPVGAKDVEALHNFGGTAKGIPGAPKNAATGLQGTYPLYLEAYQRTARKLGILPRELQSITWEGIKSLMGDEKKTSALKEKVRDIWDQVSQGALTPEEARGKIKSVSNGFAKPAWMSDEEWEKTGAEGDDTSFMGVDDNAGSGQQLTQTGWISPKGEMLPIGDEAHEDAAVRMKLSGPKSTANRASEHFDDAMERGYIRAKVGIGGHEAAFNSQTLDSSNQAILEKAIKNLPPNIDTVRVEIMKPYNYAAGSPEEVMNKLQGKGHAPGFDPSFLGGKE